MQNISSNIKGSMHEKAKIMIQNIFLNRKDYRSGTVTPKSILHTHTMAKNIPRPVYKTEEKKPERVYKSVVEISDGTTSKFYTAPYW
jgi:hypothetical protein